MSDDRGVLGNLPRSRPGQRSAKRAVKTAGDRAARPKPAAGARRAAGAAAGERQAAPSGDPVGTAIRGVAGLAVTGARVANGVAREVLRRLPRP
jgi:hypothetical protein